MTPAMSQFPKWAGPNTTPKCPWELYASPPPVAMTVVGWFLCFPVPFFRKKGFFFPYATYTK